MLIRFIDLEKNPRQNNQHAEEGIGDPRSAQPEVKSDKKKSVSDAR